VTSVLQAAVPRPLREARKFKWGYFVWIVALVVIGVPELIAAARSNLLPFTTISTMTGHLERHHTWVELVVVAGIVFGVFSMLKVRPRAKEVSVASESGEPSRTPGGRLTLRETPDVTGQDFDEEEAGAWFALAASLSLVFVAAATWATDEWAGEGHNYQTAYMLYGLLAVLWLVVPSVYAFVKGKDPPFPTLFRSVGNLQDWLRDRNWPLTLGPVLAWLVAYVIVAGLVILLLHLTLYPYPDITHILNPSG